MNQLMNNGMIQEIENILLNARNHVSVEVNHTLLKTYMEIGRIIVEDAVSHNSDNDYESKTISYLSKELTKKFGRGFSRANIWNMITFYKEYGSVQTLSERLSWFLISLNSSLTVSITKLENNLLIFSEVSSCLYNLKSPIEAQS